MASIVKRLFSRLKNRPPPKPFSFYVKRRQLWEEDDFPKEIGEAHKSHMKKFRVSVLFDPKIPPDRIVCEYNPEDFPQCHPDLPSSIHALSHYVRAAEEFGDLKEQREVMLGRLDAMVESSLTDAIKNNKADAASDLRQMLVPIGRLETMKEHYLKVHLQATSRLWEEDFDTEGFLTWLPKFYNNLFLYLANEKKWCMLVFPDEYKNIVPKLLFEMMVAIGPSFVARINLTVGDVVPETQALATGILGILDMPKEIKIQKEHLEAIIGLYVITKTFAQKIQNLFSESDPRVVADTLKMVYFPYESFKQRSGLMERAIRSSEVDGDEG